MLVRVLLALEDPMTRRRIKGLLKSSDVIVTSARLRGDLWRVLSKDNCDLLILEKDLLPDPVTSTVSRLRELPEKPEVVLLGTCYSPEDRATLLAAGCIAVLEETLPDRVLQDNLESFVARRAERPPASIGPRMARVGRLDDFISNSPAMMAFIELARRVTRSDTPLLILGETGVGKEHLARAIHNEGPRASEPFIAINCGALPETLLESELFGHEEGSFTGATRARRGFFELAHRGTLFLDEVGDMPLHLQVKLLRALQDYEILRVGSEKPISIDVRVMAATNRNVLQDIEQERFRQDLYYRLSVVTLTVPALRDRREDIASLIQRYFDHFRGKLASDVVGVSESAFMALVHYSWPGNVRELINVVERAVLLSPGPEITVADLPESIADASPQVQHATDAQQDGSPSMSIPADWMELPWSEARSQMLNAFERAYLTQVLSATSGKVGLAARAAGIQPRSLFEKMKSHGLRKESFKNNPITGTD